MPEKDSTAEDGNPNVTDFIDSTSDSLYHYKDINWRLEVVTASRAIRNIHQPQIIYQLRFNQPDGQESCQFVKSDLGNLFNFKDNMEEALNESKSNQIRKIARQLK